jgi:CTP synthase
VVGKYTHVRDAYKSIIESFVHAGAANRARVELRWIEGEAVEEKGAADAARRRRHRWCRAASASAASRARSLGARSRASAASRTLGLCLGMQVATIEFARNVVGWQEANSSEFDPQSAQKVIDLMADQADVSEKGGTMRLGAYRCELKEGSLAARAYGGARSRAPPPPLRVQQQVRGAAPVARAGAVRQVRGARAGRDHRAARHPWFLAVQFHPELKSRPHEPHPLFVDFVRASLERRVTRIGDNDYRPGAESAAATSRTRSPSLPDGAA